jgi:hypothetical protein
MQGMQVALDPARIDLIEFPSFGTAEHCIVRDLRGVEGCCRERQQIGRLRGVGRIVARAGLSERYGVLCSFLEGRFGEIPPLLRDLVCSEQGSGTEVLA